MIQTAPPPPSVEAMMLDRLRKYADRNPRFRFLLSDLREIAAECYAAVPAEPPADRRTAMDYRERAMAAARKGATKAPVRPPEAPNPPRRSATAPRAPRGRRAADSDHRALAVLGLVVEGHRNQAIADVLNMSLTQVKYRVQTWLRASGASTRAGLVAWARRTGVLDALEGTS